MPRKKRAALITWSIIAGLLIVLLAAYAIPKLELIGRQTDHKVYVAFGFHGNLYHSYRVDTNDEAGFGKDIRVMRKIISTLDEKNSRGIPVKGVWDIENLFSLQEQLPRYAPDIISNLQRRVKENGDEVILMSYNNALSSALTEDEFRDSVKRAITNDKGSGLQDLFGTWGHYVRPQEMMTTPGNFRLYKELGVEGVVLYYSAITFDAFRVFGRELTLEEAHNPLIYLNKNTGEEITIIPAYNHGDMAENIGIRQWVSMLHREQLKGNIQNDVLLFLNTDADDDYWYGYKLPSYLSWLPNTGGLNQLVDSISDLDYVGFTTLTGYMKNHKPVGTISFGQDTADGSFDGYSSWAEKAYSTDYWSGVAYDRQTQSIVNQIYNLTGSEIPSGMQDLLNQAYELRMRLMSTTNFGLATPFLASSRERVVESIISDLTTDSASARETAKAAARVYLEQNPPPEASPPGFEKIGSFMLVRQSPATSSAYGEFVDLSLSGRVPGNNFFYISGRDGKPIPAPLVSLDRCESTVTTSLRLYIPAGQRLTDGVYNLYSGPSLKDKTATACTPLKLTNGLISVELNDKGQIVDVTSGGIRRLEAGSFLPGISYGGKWYRPDRLETSVESDGSNGVAALRLTGNFGLPTEGTDNGTVDYRLMLVEDVPAIFVDANVTYPDTPRNDIFKPDNAALARRYDSNWQETAPAEINFAQGATKEVPFKVIKRNFLGVESDYLIDYFKVSAQNLDLANVNNHITAEYVAVAGEKGGLAIAMDTSRMSNFAFCPLKVNYDPASGFSLKLNPFGSYFGKQYIQPTWGYGDGYLMALYTGDQYKTSACTYSGYTSNFSLMVSFFDGRDLPANIHDGLISYAHPPYTVTSNMLGCPGIAADLETPQGFLATYGNGSVYFHWEKPKADAASYHVYCGTDKAKLSQMYVQDGNASTLAVSEFTGGAMFAPGTTYYAAIAAVDSNGKETAISDTVSFKPEGSEPKGMSVPMEVQARILLHTIMSYFN
ncbi:MAG: hypothetical protein NTY79_03790 [Chloroflexi bacterium]|nr:hypothetical protein [Chloroflexota bacterium]